MISDREIFTERGIEKGRTWSVRIESPAFPDGRIRDFYLSLKDAVKKRAARDGLNAFAYTSVTYSDPDRGILSLYTDLIFMEGKSVILLDRISDNRKNGLSIPPKRGLKCWYIKNGEIISCQNLFKKGDKCRLSSYKRFFEERVAGSFF